MRGLVFGILVISAIVMLGYGCSVMSNYVATRNATDLRPLARFCQSCKNHGLCDRDAISWQCEHCGEWHWHSDGIVQESD